MPLIFASGLLTVMTHPLKGGERKMRHREGEEVERKRGNKN